MDKQTYLKKFSYAVRWRLSKQEADEVLADYEELFSQAPREDDDLLIQKLGAPSQAARLLTDSKSYRQFLAVFSCMAFCLLLPEFWLLRSRFHQSFEEGMTVLLVAGMSVAVSWFRPHQRADKKSPFPKGLLPALSGLAMITITAIFILLSLAVGAWKFLEPSSYGRVAHAVLGFSGMTATITGFFGLVKARMSDYRWRALYVMGLLVLAECVLATAVLVSMDLRVSSDWWVSYGVRLSLLGLVGLAGVGASLC